MKVESKSIHLPHIVYAYVAKQFILKVDASILHLEMTCFTLSQWISAFHWQKFKDAKIKHVIHENKLTSHYGFLRAMT